MDSQLEDDLKGKVGRYGEKIVSYIYKFIKLIIGLFILYLIMSNLRSHGDRDHTIYFNLIITIFIYLVVLNTEKLSSYYYSDEGLNCGGDINNPCDNNILSMLSRLFTSYIPYEGNVWSEANGWFEVILVIFLCVEFYTYGKNWMIPLLYFLPFKPIGGFIYYILNVSTFSPINFLFGDLTDNTTQTLYLESTDYEEDEAAKNEETSWWESNDTDIGYNATKDLDYLNDRFFTMYVVALILIFMTIVVRLTSETNIDCDLFKSPIPFINLDGCNGYRYLLDTYSFKYGK